MDRQGDLSYAGDVGQMLGRSLIGLGLVIVVIGLALTYASKLPFRIGRLPGDIYIHKNNTTFYFPVVTCILISLLLSLVLWIFNRR